MAGLGKASHPVEREGIKRGERLTREADGVLLVIDVSRGLSLNDKRVIERLHGLRKIFVINKIDLVRRIEGRRISGLAGDSPSSKSRLCRKEISSVEGENPFDVRRPDSKKGGDDSPCPQKLLLQEALGFLVEARTLFGSGYSRRNWRGGIAQSAVPSPSDRGIRAQDVLDDIFDVFAWGSESS